MRKYLLTGLLVLVIAVVAFLVQQTNTLRTTHFTWQSSRVPQEFTGFRIVQISDLHSRRFGRGQARLVRAIEDAQPDLIVITGDLIDEHARSLDPIRELLAGIHELAPVYFIDGNHDVRSLLYEDMLALFAHYGVTALQGFYFAWHGVDISQRPHSTQLERHGATMTMGTNFESDIVLVHDPEMFPWYAAQSHSGLLLAGHTHGGQVALPNGRAIVGPFSGGLRPSWFPPFSSGVYVDGEATMFLSRGLGTSHLPIRAFATPEVAIIELKPK